MKKILAKGIDIIMVLYLISIAVLTLPCLFGYRVEAVISGSMEPVIPTGAVIFLKKADFQDIVVNDVITYWLKDSETKVTHRVIKKDTGSRSFITKGDSNDMADGAAVEYARTVGKVIWCVPVLGWMALLMTGIWGKGILAAFLLLLPALRRLVTFSWQGAGIKHKPDYRIEERRFV